ncbi:MAG TPA: hypothetical protein VFI41_05240 [Gemmatimonadales bacterium]|nr:hypothetical protein [Gemmatimonadales bacterium]
MEIEVTELVADGGSVVVFAGLDSDGARVTFAVDHRPAQELVNAMLNDEEVIAFVEPWQIMGGVL